MKIEKILKQLTPERMKKELKVIQEVKLPLELQKLVKEYEKVGDRDGFIWKWAWKVAQIITFPGVNKKYYKSLWETKFLIIMLIVMFDDVADKMKNKRLLDEILKIPFEQKNIKLKQLNEKEQKYLCFTKKIWINTIKLIKSFPKHKDYLEIIEYDFRQVLNGIRYAYLINKNPYLSNTIESVPYISHNTPAILCYMIDLTCFSNFEMKNLRLIRKIAWYSQLMTRIANGVTTWEREIKEKDFTSEIFVYTMENNIFSFNDLNNKEEYKIIRKIKSSNAEKYFLRQWGNYYNEVIAIVAKNKFSNNKKLHRVLRKLIILHLISKGLI